MARALGRAGPRRHRARDARATDATWRRSRAGAYQGIAQEHFVEFDCSVRTQMPIG